jgi:hypothetical protein
MRTKFEEKSYENYFNNELDRSSNVYFPLGQVQEGGLGFDSTAFSTNRRLWRLLGHPYLFHLPFKGVDFKDLAHEMETIIGYELDNIPEMKTNLFFQYKRPDFIKSSRAGEWTFWRQPYYRYNIYREQQILLEHIHNTFTSQLLVLYAAPAIKDVNHLVNLHANRQIIASSNFTRAIDLSGHHRNSYIRSGTDSYASSEPTKISSIDLLKEIGEKIKEAKIAEKGKNREFYKGFVIKMISTINEFPFLSGSFQKLNEPLNSIKEFELFYYSMTMHNLRQLTGNQWIISTK